MSLLRDSNAVDELAEHMLQNGLPGLASAVKSLRLVGLEVVNSRSGVQIYPWCARLTGGPLRSSVDREAQRQEESPTCTLRSLQYLVAAEV